MTFGKTTFLAPRVEVGVTVENVEVQKESACFEWTELLRGSVFVAQPRREEVRTQVLGAQERRCICRGWKVVHCLVKMAFKVFCGGRCCGWCGAGIDRWQEELKAY